MKKLVTAVVFGTLFSVSAMAGEATVLTAKQMDGVTAAGWGDFIRQSNRNFTYQNATAVAVGGCSFCKNSGNASAFASNYNNTDQENEVE